MVSQSPNTLYYNLKPTPNGHVRRVKGINNSATLSNCDTIFTNFNGILLDFVLVHDNMCGCRKEYLKRKRINMGKTIYFDKLLLMLFGSY